MTKPRLSYAATFGATAWDEAFAKVKDLPKGAKLKAQGMEFELDWIAPEPHPPSVWLKFRDQGKTKTYICRRGDVLLLELAQ